MLTRQKKKDKAKKKKTTVTDESAECDPPAPKKVKREKVNTANGTVQKSPDVNGNVGRKLSKVKSLPSSDEHMNPSGEQSEVITL